MEKIRLQKYLAQCGVASRRQAEQFILEGLVRVNGRIESELGTKIDPAKDKVQFRGKPLHNSKLVYYALNKPTGYVATRQDIYAPKKVIDLVPPLPPVYPVGRLDKDTEGLILLTNDGALTNQLIHPKHHIEKEYIVIARPRFEDFQLDKAIKKLTKGVLITGYLTKPAKIKNILSDRQKVRFNLIISEGKKHQIRRMCHNVGLKVITLTRIRMGNLHLGRVPRGSYRILTKQEIEGLYNLSQSNRHQQSSTAPNKRLNTLKNK